MSVLRSNIYLHCDRNASVINLYIISHDIYAQLDPNIFEADQTATIQIINNVNEFCERSEEAAPCFAPGTPKDASLSMVSYPQLCCINVIRVVRRKLETMRCPFLPPIAAIAAP